MPPPAAERFILKSGHFVDYAVVGEYTLVSSRK